MEVKKKSVTIQKALHSNRVKLMILIIHALNKLFWHSYPYLDKNI